MTVSAALDRRFRDAAAAAGLLDVGFDVVDSPIGPLLVAATDTACLPHLVRAPTPTSTSTRWPRAFGPRVLRSQRVGRRRRTASSTSTSPAAGTAFELDVDTAHSAPFAQRVLDELARVPFGETTTYGALARRSARRAPPARSAWS